MRGVVSSLEIVGDLLTAVGHRPQGADSPEGWMWMTGALMVVLVFVWAAFFGLMIYSCIWAGGDAERRGKSGALIGVLVFFTWPLGLLIWLVARPEWQMPPLPPAPNVRLSPGEWVGYSLLFLVVPAVNVVVSSLLYYVWRNRQPRKARQINGLGWGVVIFQVLLFGAVMLTGTVQHGH